LSLESSIDLDEASNRRRQSGKRTANDTFQETMFRQPSLAEGRVSPLPYRKPRQSFDEGPPSPMPEFADASKSKWDFMESGSEPSSPPLKHEIKHVAQKPVVSAYTSPSPATQGSFDRRNMLMVSKQESFIENYIDHFELMNEVENEKADEADVEIDALLQPSDKHTPSKSSVRGTDSLTKIGSFLLPKGSFASVSTSKPQESDGSVKNPLTGKEQMKENSPIVEVGESSNLLKHSHA
jgi:hypothetical protein